MQATDQWVNPIPTMPAILKIVHCTYVHTYTEKLYLLWSANPLQMLLIWSMHVYNAFDLIWFDTIYYSQNASMLKKSY